MLDDTEDSVDLWRQVASAVEYVAAVERPGFTVWEALAEAIAMWSSDDEADGRARERSSWVDSDPLRTGLGELLSVASPTGSPGGVLLADVVHGALTSWLAAVSSTLNQGHRFREGAGH